MKTIKLICGLFIMGSFIFIGCQKSELLEGSNPLTMENSGLSNIGNYFQNNLENSIQHITVNPNDNNIIGNKYGTVVNFGSNTFTYADGSPVAGPFEIEFIEALHKREMLMLNKQTVTSDGQLLVSGGIVYINATQNNGLIQLSINDDNPVQVSLPSTDYLAMDYFNGGVDLDGDFAWNLSIDDTVITNTNENGNDTLGGFFIFDFEVDSVGWINCDYFYSSGDPLTDVEVDLPEGYNGDNTMVFIYYNDINSVANMNYSQEDGIFNLGYSYETPIGMDVNFVVVSDINGSYYYSVVSTIIIENHLEIIENNSINGPYTEEEITNFINNL